MALKRITKRRAHGGHARARNLTLAGDVGPRQEHCMLFPTTRFSALHWLRTSMWFWPLVCIGGGMAPSTSASRWTGPTAGAWSRARLTGDPDAALEILGHGRRLDGEPHGPGADSGLGGGPTGDGPILPSHRRHHPAGQAQPVRGRRLRSRHVRARNAGAEPGEHRRGRRVRPAAWVLGRLRPGHRQHHGAGPVREPHRPQAPGRVAG